MRTEQEWKNLEAERDALAARRVQEMRDGHASSVKFRLKIEKLAGLLTQTEKSVVDIVQHDNSVEEVKMPWAAWALLRAQVINTIEAKCLSDEALATPDASAQILARRDAAIWMEAAEVCNEFQEAYEHNSAQYASDALRAKSDELLKGSEKEHGN